MTKNVSQFFQTHIQSSYHDVTSFKDLFNRSSNPLILRLNIQSLNSKYESLKSLVSDLLNALQGRYDKLSENYRKSWNNVEGLVSLNPTLYNDPKGGGLAIKSWRSDIDGAYFKNPGNAEFRSVYSDFERYVQTHKKKFIHRDIKP
jgi:hypothetical protein